eukprot:gnl/Trimastix_PCT/2414.p1 GENE.gnl/Trimastix_PCT/2414~~gnl/Trimastix_PCT/2414.p1  ORF type:complete len:133 (+),score=12.81 gnl/Trimastix_PCT/2414:84-482(+)
MKLHLILFALFLLTCSAYQMEFSVTQCSSDIPPYEPPTHAILGTQWTQDSTFVVDAYVKTYCGGAQISGDSVVQEEEGRIILHYQIHLDEAISRCICAKQVQYRFIGLEPREYQVSFAEKPEGTLVGGEETI